MLVYPVTTDLYTRQAQARLRRELASPAPALARPPGVIRIPRIGLDAVLVEGVDPGALRAGPGHYPQTPEPCHAGNVAVAGHRTTYGRPFNRLGELVPGDEIALVTPERRCTYVVVPPLRRPAAAGRAFWITSPTDWSVVGPAGGSFLTLTTCSPPGSASKRLIVRARLQG